MEDSTRMHWTVLKRGCVKVHGDERKQVTALSIHIEKERCSTTCTLPKIQSVCSPLLGFYAQPLPIKKALLGHEGVVEKQLKKVVLLFFTYSSCGEDELKPLCSCLMVVNIPNVYHVVLAPARFRDNRQVLGCFQWLAYLFPSDDEVEAVNEVLPEFSIGVALNGC